MDDATGTTKTMNSKTTIIIGVCFSIFVCAFVYIFTGSEGDKHIQPSPAPANETRGGRAAVAPATSNVESNGARQAVQVSDGVESRMRSHRQLKINGIVNDMRNLRVPDADVYFIDDKGEMVSTARSDVNGAFSIILDPFGLEMMAASKIGYADGLARVPRAVWAEGSLESETRVVLVLRDSGVIEGRVETFDKATLERRLSVLAWPENVGSPSRNQVIRSLAGGPVRPYLSTTLNVDGSFKIEGVAIGVRYFITCGGEGWVSDSAPVLKFPGEFVNLSAKVLYVFDVEFIDSTGNQIEHTEYLYPSQSMVSQGERLPADWEVVQPDDPTVLLAAPGLKVATVFTSAKIERLFSCPARAERLGPNVFKFFAPGYHPVETGIFAVRYSPGVEVRQKVKMDRSGEGFGEVKIRILGETESILTHRNGVDEGRDEAPAFITLQPKSVSGSIGILRFLLWQVPCHEINIPKVPVGKYRMTLGGPFLPQDGTYSADVEVLNHSVCEATFSMGAKGAVEVLIDSQSEDLGLVNNFGRVIVVFTATNSAEEFGFDRSPYKISWLRPGRYKVHCLSPSRKLVSPAQEIEVLENSLVTVTIVMKERK